MGRSVLGRLVFSTALTTTCAATLATAKEPKDLYFGEALYHAYQEEFFEALTRLDSELAQYHRVDEPEKDTLYAYIGDAEFSVGDFELDYRMHQRAGRAISAVLEDSVEEPVRNDAAYRLARLQFREGQSAEALRSLDRIHGVVPENIRDDVKLLRANIDLATGQPEEAVRILLKLEDSKESRAVATYNLGIALLRNQQSKEALQTLDKAGRLKLDGETDLAIRDKSNLVLGNLLFESGNFDLSQQALNRVRLAGPFSNQALLRAGWADLSSGKSERALVPLGMLAVRDSTDPAVQEALLALPYAYSKLAIHGRAAVLYGEAVETYTKELEKLDASIQSIRDGRFLEALVQENMRHDKDWVIRLRSLPDAPETFYLVSLISSHAFQTGLQNYLDLEDLRTRLVRWDESLSSFDDLIRLRRNYYEPRLPEIDRRFRKLDAQMRLRLEQREHLAQRLQNLLVAPQPELLATAEEQFARAQLERLKAGLGDSKDPTSVALAAQIRRLEGVLRWRLETLYHQRLTEAHRHLRELNQEVAVLGQRYESFVRARQAATHSYEGYGPQIARLRAGIREDTRRVDDLMTRQGQALETVSIQELVTRRDHLQKYLNQARFAFADSYDRAAKNQAN